MIEHYGRWWARGVNGGPLRADAMGWEVCAPDTGARGPVSINNYDSAAVR